MKPPILSDEEIDEVIGKLVGERYLARHATDKEAKDIATAQRDADAAWFRAEIEKVENPHHLYDGIGQDVCLFQLAT